MFYLFIANKIKKTAYQLLILSLVSISTLASVELDTSFGNKQGYSQIDILGLDTTDQQGCCVVQLSSGNLLVAGSYRIEDKVNLALFLYKNDGLLDESFGENGRLLLKVSQSFSPQSMIQQSDGKIVIAGFGGDKYHYNGSEYTGSEFILVRLNADGTLDTAFGSENNGIVTSHIHWGYYSASYSLLQQHDGKLVAIGITKVPNYPNSMTLGVIRFNVNGDLDETFGTGGKINTSISASPNSRLTILQQLDNKLVVAGSNFNEDNTSDSFIARYQLNGVLDNSFGNNGVLINNFDTQEGINAITQQSNGKLISVGYIDNGFHVDKDFIISRYNVDGTLDISFGEGGIVIDSLGESHDELHSIVLQADDTLTVAGQSNNDIVVTRYTPEGNIDTQFGNNGRAIIDIANVNIINSLIEQSDEKFVVVGTARQSNNDLSIIRLNNNGSLDTSFNGQGFSIKGVIGSKDIAESVALQTDGKLLVTGGSYDGSLSTTRYNQDGSLDLTLNNTGILNTKNIGTGRSVIQQADGKILIAGDKSTLRYWPGENDATNVTTFALTRYLQDGSLDPDFGELGIVTTDFIIPDFYLGQGLSSVIQQADGKLVAIGQYQREEQSIALVRYNIDGSLDNTFATNGVITANYIDSGYRDIIQQTDGKLLLVGYTAGDSNPKILLTRYNLDGELDLSFGGTGSLVTDINGVAYSVLQQTDQKLVVVGKNNEKSIVLRFNLDGSPDSTFNNGTIINEGLGCITLRCVRSEEIAYSVIQQEDNKLVTASQFTVINADSSKEYHFILTRYHSDGRLDLSFDNDGIFLVPGQGNEVLGKAGLAYRYGTFFLAGSANYGVLSDFILAKVVEKELAPVFIAPLKESVIINEDSGGDFLLTLSAFDSDGNDITWSISDNANHGVAEVEGVGQSKSITYLPLENYNGIDSFNVQITDGIHGTSILTVNVEIIPVNDLPTGEVTITGEMVEGQTITAGNTLEDNDGIGDISYSWERDGVVIGTGATYVLNESDVNYTLVVVASYIDHQGNSEVINSAPTPIITPLPEPPSEPNVPDHDDTNKSGGGPFSPYLVLLLSVLILNKYKQKLMKYS